MSMVDEGWILIPIGDSDGKRESKPVPGKELTKIIF